MEKHKKHITIPGEGSLSGRRETIFTYTVSDTSLGHGASLGNAHAWATTKGTGDIANFYSTDIDREITGSLVINFFAKYRDLLKADADSTSGNQDDGEMIVRLPPQDGGHFTIHPAYMEHTYNLTGDLSVVSTFFLPNTGDSDPAVALNILEVENRSILDHELILIGCLYLPGTTGHDIKTKYDPDLEAVVAWNEHHPDWVRAFGALPSPDGYLVTHDIERAWNPNHPLGKQADEAGDVAASLQKRLSLAPGEKKKLVLILAFTPHGSEQIAAVYNGARPYEELLQKTMDHYRNVLLTADVMTPDDVLNQGTQWCKANMLRVLADYPTGRAFTNDPGKSSKVVARDSAWFVYGADYILPETSCCLMEAFAGRQQDNGKIIEYYDALSDEREDYGLNINDDTPLFILAAVHHCDITGHTQCRKRLYPAVCKAADYIISQEDKRGLVYCTADGVGVYGIVGWRNIIPDMSISGAVTEVNAESYAALRAAARFAGKVGDGHKADYYHSKADALRAAIQKHLRNPENGMYYLNIDIHGNPGTEVTADELFPMIFGVADEDSMRLIRLRLSNSDFMTDAGLRTVSSLSPFFTPDTFSGLRGGVWPGVTWWYAMASTEADPGLMVDSLKRSYQQYTVHPPAHNTVPGQFSEWFDGLSLVNRGMRLSPWEPPRFLWAIIEGGLGLDITGDDVWIRPRIPYDWKWLWVRELKVAQGTIGFFAARIDGNLVFYTASDFIKTEKTELYDKELTQRLAPISPNTVAAAFASESKIIACFGNTAGEKEAAPFQTNHLLDANADYQVRLYQSETGRWVDLGRHHGKRLLSLTVDIEPYGFALFTFEA